ncbi:MAG: hypothetical protein KAU44_05225 [Candidatus Marinimicrobia bacterium]|nr:hypothetical protein [Candidatus Neomarinimicrobiota bacterium]
MTKIWEILKIAAIPIGIFLLYINFFERINQFIKHIFNRNKSALLVLEKIIDWFNFIHSTMKENDFDLIKLNSIEDDIDFLFKQKKYSKIIIHFDKTFINKYLKSKGIKKSGRTENIFIKYSKIGHPQLHKILQIISNEQKNEYTPLNMPLKTFWGIIRGCFYIFYKEYGDPNFNNGAYTVNYSSIESQIELLKLYYKLY